MALPKIVSTRAIFGLLSLLLFDAVAGFDTCSAAAISVLPTSGTACCPALPTKRAVLDRRLLLSRNDKCNDGSDPCCTAKEHGPPVVSDACATANLQCGQGYDPGSDTYDIPGGVTYSLEPCPNGPYAGQTCFHVQLTAAADATIEDIHLNIDNVPFDPNAPPALGRWPFNSYCQYAGNVGNCWVPESTVLDVFSTPPPTTPVTSLCDQTIYVAAGISIQHGSSSDTCFNQGTQIGTHPWFMYTKVTFDCPDVCSTYCCCPPPPDQFQWCSIGTAFGYAAGAINFNGQPVGPALGLKTCNRWGWYFNDTNLASSPLNGVLYVGAGGNDIGKATPVGTFSATLSGANLQVVFELYNNDQQGHFNLSEVHIYASCSKPSSCAPGSYTFPGSTVLDLSTAGYHYEVSVPISGAPCSTYYLIFHAKVNQRFAASTTCPAAVT